MEISAGRVQDVSKVLMMEHVDAKTRMGNLCMVGRIVREAIYQDRFSITLIKTSQSPPHTPKEAPNAPYGSPPG
jgi:hypothetical protein